MDKKDLAEESEAEGDGEATRCGQPESLSHCVQGCLLNCCKSEKQTSTMFIQQALGRWATGVSLP